MGLLHPALCWTRVLNRASWVTQASPFAFANLIPLANPRATARVPTPHPLFPRPYNDYERFASTIEFVKDYHCVLAKVH